MVRLDIGAGQHSDYEYQIDLVQHEKTTHKDGFNSTVVLKKI